MTDKNKTYKINGKEYELKMEHRATVQDPENIFVELEAADGEIRQIYWYKGKWGGDPAEAYAGGGMFWDDCSFDGEKAIPARGAVKITDEEWCRLAAREHVDNAFEFYIDLPDEDECEERGKLLEKIERWLRAEFETMIREVTLPWVEDRTREEKEEGGAE